MELSVMQGVLLPFLGSVLGATVFAIGFGVLHYNDPVIMAGGIFIGLLAVFMHRGNIVRLCKGTEKKVHLIHWDDRVPAGGLRSDEAHGRHLWQRSGAS